MSIIAIAGENGVGKDTVGKIIQYLVEEKRDVLGDGKLEYTIDEYLNKPNFLNYFNDTWQIKKFAGKVNECYKIITGVDFHSLSREDKEDQRKYFKAFAEGVKKSVYEEVWCESLMENYEQYSQDQARADSDFYPNWIITDTRFDYEFEAIKERGGLTILVMDKRGTLPRGLEGQQFDYVIENNGTIEELIQKVREFLIVKKII